MNTVIVWFDGVYDGVFMFIGGCGRCGLTACFDGVFVFVDGCGMTVCFDGVFVFVGGCGRGPGAPRGPLQAADLPDPAAPGCCAAGTDAGAGGGVHAGPGGALRPPPPTRPTNRSVLQGVKSLYFVIDFL